MHVTSWFTSRDSENGDAVVEYECTRARGADVSRGNANSSERWGAHGLDGKERAREHNAGAVERNENGMTTHDRCGREHKRNTDGGQRRTQSTRARE